MTDIRSRIKAERTARATDPMRPANPLLREADEEIERLRAALEPFAEVARWAERNGHDLMKGWDMLIRGPEATCHLGVQSPEFINALRAMNGHEIIDYEQAPFAASGGEMHTGHSDDCPRCGK